MWKAQADHSCQICLNQSSCLLWARVIASELRMNKSASLDPKGKREVHNCLRALVDGTRIMTLPTVTIYIKIMHRSPDCQTLHKHYLFVLNWQCLQYKDRAYWFVFSRKLSALRRSGIWMLFVHPQKAYPRHCKCRLLSSDLGKRCQGLSGSFTPVLLSDTTQQQAN